LSLCGKFTVKHFLPVMKIFDAQQTREADKTTITNQGITSLDLMERAAKEAFLWFKKTFPDKETVFHVFCGQGNNGGDGLVIARLLHLDGYTVFINIIASAGNPTDDFTASLQKLQDTGVEYNKEAEISSFGKGKAVVIDAIFGIGLTRGLDQECIDYINLINSSKAFVVSIDVPSGIFMDKPTSCAVMADVVITFQYPKLPFFLPSNYKYVDKAEVLNIGLDTAYLTAAPSQNFYIDIDEASLRYRPVDEYAHKGTQGHALIIGGSYGKIGAVVLSAKAALKAGCGLVTAFIPECGYTVMQTAFPEAMVLTGGSNHIEQISFSLEPKAIALGMGIGQHEETQQALYDFLLTNKVPLVIDADALNILAQHKDWLQLLPEHTILTPHPKELQRLIGQWQDDFEKLEMMKAFSSKHKIVLVAKDARTITVYMDGIYINSTGNSALATSGSGDVLAGIITGLLAQGYNPVDAAIFGVYLHGLTADIAVKETGKQAFTASTIPEYLGKAYLHIERHANR
jgi:hydroxyethylthiazole kinase-like uncharacterized protein yjeF